ncbi:MAG: FAD-binding oxidoreductase [Verrucomicrobiae bacterium]|nr:FAD-binding oxidoreductase [Verrucomicrobiae bacterium]
MKTYPTIDADALAKQLKKNIEGEVRFDAGSRALYATDSSNYRQTPVGVVIPKNKEDIVKTVAICYEHHVPITSRGAGTSLAGQCCNVSVIIDFSKYFNRILEINPEKKYARVEPGIVLDILNQALQKHGLIFGPDPATHHYCTLGGMIGNNSCGIHSVMAAFAGTGARTSDNILELEILTYDGLKCRVGKTSDAELESWIKGSGRENKIYQDLIKLRNKYEKLIREKFPKIPRRVSGYNLDELLPEKGFHLARALVGTEGTCVTVLEAKVQLIDNPPIRSLAVLGFSDVFTAADQVKEVLEFHPVGLEGVDEKLIEGMKKKGLHPQDISLLPEGKGWLLVEFGGASKEEADQKAQQLINHYQKKKKSVTTKWYDAPFYEEHVWEIRESGLGASARVPDEADTWEGWEDSAVPPEKMGDYLRDFQKLLDRYNYQGVLYGHFGQGVLHTRINFGLKSHQGIKNYLSFTNEAADLVVYYGGSLSGEHGDGQSRGELLGKMYGRELVEAFREFKTIWDPEGKMNPHKVVEPFSRDEDLRYGQTYDPPQWSTHFQYPEDKGSFSYAMERCVGVGKCRKTDQGIMCPSYMVTREEKHSTRGRARLLFEMLQGKVIGKKKWRDPAVKEALDLCLACKGCKSECPVQVDMATYKAEFFSHYYQGRLRPLSAYAMGLIYWWARLASKLPTLVNFFTHTQPFEFFFKKLGGLAPQRTLPKFAKEPFRQWFYRRKSVNLNKPKLILWPDTFNNYFFPETAKAAVEVLEYMGYQVTLPKRTLCCGRPLYDFGMLNLAKMLLRQILENLAQEIEEGIPIIGLEPSCVAVFRDELRNLFPQDENAKRLSKNVFLLSEFLEQKAASFSFPLLRRKAIVQGHCHHHALTKLTDEEKILKRLGLDFTLLDSGCCGMAGSFGFEKKHFEISQACGERVLLPTVRQADPDFLIIANGFSCREQIQQLAHRQAYHLAEVIQMAIQQTQPGRSL